MNTMILISLMGLFAVGWLLAYIVSTYNGFVGLSQNIDKGWSNIDVVLKQRFDELPKLVEVCNSYMAHERDTLEAVTKARTGYEGSRTVDDKARAENHITQALRTLFAVAEQYPDLKANQEFLHVQQRISAIESIIADRREFYNDAVTLYNIRIAQIPALWVAQQSGYRSRPLLDIPKAHRENAPLAFANRVKHAEIMSS